QVYETVTKAASGSDALGGLLGGMGGGNIGGLLQSLTGSGGSGEDMVNQLLGSGSTAIAGVVRERTGVDSAPILTMATPVRAGVVGKMVKERNLDANGLASLLQTESKQFAAQNPEMAGIISSALSAGAGAAGASPAASASAPATAAAAPPASGTSADAGM